MKKKTAAKTSLLAVINNALADLKAQEVVAIDVTRLSDVMDTLIIASGSSNRQVRALAQHAAEEAKKNGMPAMGMEGIDDGEWALVDFGDVVLHVMQPETRAFYELEKLWLIPGSSETIAIDSKKMDSKKITAKTKTAPAQKTATAKKPGKPAAVKKAPMRKKVTEDVVVNQSDASKARRRKAAATKIAATTARKKTTPKTAADAPVKAGIYAKTGTRKPATPKPAAGKSAPPKKTAAPKKAAASPKKSAPKAGKPAARKPRAQ
jgi:ribosome-associated protein